MVVARYVLVGLLFGVAASGCSSTETPDHPDKLLSAAVQAWEDAKAHEAPATLPGSFKIEDPDKLRHRFEQLAQIYPNHVPTLVANGIVAYDAHLPERAQEYLDRALALQPLHPDAACLRARIACEQGDFPFARKLLEEQVRGMPDHAALREALGGVLYDTGSVDRARAELEAARRLGAPAWRVDFNLGLIEEGAGNLDEALRLDALAADENHDYAPARSRLNALRASVMPVAVTHSSRTPVVHARDPERE